MELDLSLFLGSRVYYVDTDDESGRALEYALLDSGLEVLSWTSVPGVLYALREGGPLVAVVVAASQLPGGTDAFLREVRAIDPRITRIKLTGPTEAPDRRDPEVCEQMMGKDQLFCMENALLTRLFTNLCRAHAQCVVAEAVEQYPAVREALTMSTVRAFPIPQLWDLLRAYLDLPFLDMEMLGLALRLWRMWGGERAEQLLRDCPNLATAHQVVSEVLCLQHRQGVPMEDHTTHPVAPTMLLVLAFDSLVRVHGVAMALEDLRGDSRFDSRLVEILAQMAREKAAELRQFYPPVSFLR